ncbi:MAG: hypothetical protein JWR80_7981 [Bradyrhizobium sp.]|nr:hypothetical protein [Bradyrhizobium sp.]
MRITVSSKKGLTVNQVENLMAALNGQPKPHRLDCCGNPECGKVLSIAEIAERYCEACNTDQVRGSSG